MTAPSSSATPASPDSTTTVRTAKKVASGLQSKVIQMAEDRSRTTRPIAPPVPIKVIPYEFIGTGALLGTGSFSSGFAIKELFEEPSEGLVMKKLRPEVLRSPVVFAACAADLKMEGNILATMSHPNVVRLEAWSCENMIEEYLRGSYVSSYLILERLDETLEDRMNKWTRKSPAFWHKFSRRKVLMHTMRQHEKCIHIWRLAQALEHIHSYRVLHRDLKPANIGFDSKGTLKLFDFDLARVLPDLDEGDPDKAYQLTALVGSRRYMAAEVNHGQPYNLKADIWSFGVLAYQMLTNIKPNGGIDRDYSKTNKMIPSDWSEELRSVISRCCRQNPLERPSSERIQKQLEQQYGSQLLVKNLSDQEEGPTQ
ncbi:unnamed protein product [Cylindrotheca closterium]|uniref:non-specific serine/threonine protein kinase n=1 Tax=Cylindrotheca closterium TaxID=2856 RepID=A0AAD2FYV6_9STRA|nr:unnamed protein product [Cylindrotheca closterium]